MKKSYNLIVEVIASFFIIVGLAVSGAIILVNTNAQGLSMETPFGGVVVVSLPCTSENAGDWWFILSGPGESSGNYVVEAPATSEYNTNSLPLWGTHYLGFYEMDSGSCTFGYSPYEVELQYQYRVTSAGTS